VAELRYPADIVVDKTANFAFHHSDLDHILRGRGGVSQLFRNRRRPASR
jgi:hypothetical protein